MAWIRSILSKITKFRSFSQNSNLEYFHGGVLFKVSEGICNGSHESLKSLHTQGAFWIWIRFRKFYVDFCDQYRYKKFCKFLFLLPWFKLFSLPAVILRFSLKTICFHLVWIERPKFWFPSLFSDLAFETLKEISSPIYFSTLKKISSR